MCVCVCFISVQTGALVYTHPEVIWDVQLKCPVVVPYFSLHYSLDKGLSLNWKRVAEQPFW